MSSADPVLLARGLSRHFVQAKSRVDVLQDVNLSVGRGESLAVLGASGSGKSTLLHLLGGLDAPSAGEVLVEGVDLASLSDRRRGLLRNAKLGFVYQFHHLLPEFSALENVALPAVIGGESVGQAYERARDLLARVGLSERLSHRPGALSGGERQRAAIARALVSRPACLLADEPTGNLDRGNAALAFDLMLELKRDLGTAVVVVTHDAALAERMDRVVFMVDGRLQSEAA